MIKYILPIILFCSPVFALRSMTIPIITNATMGATEIDSTIIDLSQILNVSISAIYTGSPNGTIQIQYSNAVTQSTPAQIVATPSLIPLNSWITYTGSSQTISAAGSFGWNLTEAGYRYIRLQYLGASGSGVLNATMTTKGE